MCFRSILLKANTCQLFFISNLLCVFQCACVCDCVLSSFLMRCLVCIKIPFLPALFSLRNLQGAL